MSNEARCSFQPRCRHRHLEPREVAQAVARGPVAPASRQVRPDGHRLAPASQAADLSGGSDRASGKSKWSATRVDLVFGSNSQLRALAQVHGVRDAQEKFLATSSPRRLR